MSQENVPPEWQEVRKIYEHLSSLGFSLRIENFGVYSAQDSLFTVTMIARHQVEWLRTYADIFYVAPLQQTFIVNAPDMNDFFCVVVFRMKDPLASLPLADPDAILPPKPKS